jgi:O-antigen ligase
MNLEKINITYSSATNIVFSFFPLSFILGNLIINFNILLFILLGIIQLKSKVLNINYNLTIKIIFTFFLVVFISTFISSLNFFYINEYELNELERLIKSVVFFRFFLFLIIAYLLIENDMLQLNYFFVTAAFFPLLIAIDVIFQYFVGYNIIGLKSFSDHHIEVGRYVSSFFGDELIAGGYIKNFSFFSILFLVFKFKNNSYLKFTLGIILISILASGILLSGNRMPFPLFLLGLFLLLFFGTGLKKIISLSIISIVIIFNFLMSFDQAKVYAYGSFYTNIKYSLNTLKKKLISKESKKSLKEENLESADKPVTDFDSFWKSSFIKSKEEQGGSSGQIELFLTAFDLWAENKIIGNGIKSFRKNCGKLQQYKRARLCSSHPHNYYIEILTETGIIGLLNVLIIGLIFLIFIYKNFNFLRDQKKGNLILLASVLSLFLEVFPFRSSGSVFTTHNATYIILVGSIILSYKSRVRSKF